MLSLHERALLVVRALLKLCEIDALISKYRCVHFKFEAKEMLSCFPIYQAALHSPF